MVAGLVLSATLGSASVVTPVYQIFCALFAFFFIDRIVGYVMRPKIRVTSQFPDRTSARAPVQGTFKLENQGRWTAYDVGVRFFQLPISIEQPDAEATLGQITPGRSLTTTLRLRPDRRGSYSLPRPRAYSTFPFHFFRDGRSKSETLTLLVLPHFHPLVRLDLPVGARYQPGGIALTSNIGESPEYIGNREYVAGDSARRIDYRSWARLGRPIVREYQEEYYCRVALVLDTFPAAGPKGRFRRKTNPAGDEQLEAAISLSASIADALSRGEYLLDLFAAGPELYVFRAGRHTAHLENVLEILACVDACRENPFDKVSPAISEELNNISTVVGVFLDWDASRAQLARTAAERGCSVVIYIVRDGETSEPIEFDEGRVIQIQTDAIRSGGLESL